MVKKSTLKKHGAVSEKCAKEMAKGGAFATGADAALSVTGFAGPDGGENVPVGTVFIGCTLKGKLCTGASLSRGPEQHQRTGCCLCLVLLRECILENFQQKDRE